MITRSKGPKNAELCCSTCTPTSRRPTSQPTKQSPAEKKPKKVPDCGEKKKEASCSSDKAHKITRTAKSTSVPIPIVIQQSGSQEETIESMSPPYDLDGIYGLLVDKSKVVKK